MRKQTHYDMLLAMFVSSSGKRSPHQMRGKLLLCLMDLCDEDDEVLCTADWVHVVDQGELVNVSENTVFLFQQMEMIIHSVLNKEKTKLMINGVRQKLHKTIIEDEDIALYWCMLTMEIEDSEGAVLLGMIVELFITIRGFSFSKSVYKQENKECTQKAKALR